MLNTSITNGFQFQIYWNQSEIKPPSSVIVMFYFWGYGIDVVKGDGVYGDKDERGFYGYKKMFTSVLCCSNISHLALNATVLTVTINPNNTNWSLPKITFYRIPTGHVYNFHLFIIFYQMKCYVERYGEVCFTEDINEDMTSRTVSIQLPDVYLESTLWLSVSLKFYRNIIHRKLEYCKWNNSNLVY